MSTKFRYPAFASAFLATVVMAFAAMLDGNAVTTTLFTLALLATFFSALLEKDRRAIDKKLPHTYTTSDGAVITELPMPELSKRSAVDIPMDPPEFPKLIGLPEESLEPYLSKPMRVISDPPSLDDDGAT